MKKINKITILTLVLGISLAFAAGCGKKETKDTSDEDLTQLTTPSTEAESTLSDAEAEVKAAMDTVYATVQENVSVVNPDYDPTIMYTDYEYYNDGEVHKVSWLRIGKDRSLGANYRDYSFPEAGIESISLPVLNGVAEFKDAEKVNYTLKDVADKWHLTYDDFILNFPLKTYDITEAEEVGLFMYNAYDQIRSWRVKTDTYQIDPEHIDIRSIVAAYMTFPFDRELDAPLEDGGVAPIGVDPSKVWIVKEEDGTTDYFFLTQDVAGFSVDDAEAVKELAEGESVNGYSNLDRAYHLGMMCVRVNPNYDWVHCILHNGFNRFNGSDYDTPYLFDNSNYILRTTAKFTTFDKITEGKIWNGCKPDSERVRVFMDTGH